MTNTATNEPHELDGLAERARQVLDRVEPETKPAEAAGDAAMARAAATPAAARTTGDPQHFVSKITEAAQAAAVPRTVITEPDGTIDLTDTIDLREPRPAEPSSEAQSEDDQPTAVAATTAAAGVAADGPGTELAVYEPDEDRGGGFPLIWLVLIGLLLGALVVFGDELWDAAFGDDTPAASDQSAADGTDATTDASAAAADGAATDSADTAAASSDTAVFGARLSNEPFTTMWEALQASGRATEFLAMARSLGLEDDLNSAVGANGLPVRRTLFAPTDEAIAALSPARLNHLAVTPADAEAVIGYHQLDLPLTAEQLRGLDGTPLPSILGGLQMSLQVEDGVIVLNRSARIVEEDIRTDNGIVHLIDVVLDPPTVNEAVGLNSIGFEHASATITPAGERELRKAVNFFEQFPVGAVIEGHTDTTGIEENNLWLSQARADAVRAFLIEQGIAADRLLAIGFGETRPILVDGVEDADASRRIEFVVR